MAEDRRRIRAQRRRDERRAALLRAGTAVFARKGFHDTSVTDLVEAAGVARGTFYLYFESKHALFDAVLDELIGEIERGIARVDLSPGAPPVLDQLRANVRFVLTLPLDRPDLSRLFLHQAFAVGDASDRKLDSFHQRLFALTKRSLDLGVQMGLVRPCDTDVVARALVGIVKEVFASMAVRGDLAGREVDDVADTLLDLATRGVLRRSE